MPDQPTLDDAVRERDAVLDLIADDWIHEPSNRAVAAAILRAGREHPHGWVTSNAVRDLLPPWVAPHCIGAMFRRLSSKRVGLIEQVEGVTVKSNDRSRRSHNVGRPVPVWRLTPRAYEKEAA